MRKTKSQLAKFAAIAMLSVGAVALMTPAVGAAPFTKPLSAEVKAYLDIAISQAKINAPKGASPEEVQGLIANAISAETQSLISRYGTEHAAEIATLVVEDARADGASEKAIGAGLAGAAVAEYSRSPAVADAIAGAVGDAKGYGYAALADSFESAVSDLGAGNTKLVANLDNTVFTASGGKDENIAAGNGTTQSNFGSSGTAGGASGGGGGGGGCRNPSCT